MIRATAIGGALLALGLGLLAAPARAQAPEAAGARAAALGGAFVGLADDGYAVFWNPGALPFVGHQELSGATTLGNLYADHLDDGTFLYHFPVTDFHALALGWRHAGQTDGELAFAANHFSFGYGFRLGRGFGLGVTARYLRESVDLDAGRVSDWSGWTGDLGVQYRRSERWSAGAVFRNVNNLDVTHDTGRKERLAENTQSWVLGGAYRLRPDVTLVADVDDRLHVGAEYTWQRLFSVQAGLQRPLRSLYGEATDGNTYSLGVSARLKGIKLDLARVFPPVLPATSRVSVGMEFSLSPSRVRVDKTQVDNVFASYAKRYAEKPVGTARITSKADAPLTAKLSLFVPGFMAGPTEKEVVLRPKETKDVNLNAIFSQEILALDDDRPALAELRVSYQTKSRTRVERARTQFYLYRPGAISWSDLQAAAAFVTAQDPVVSDFARALVAEGSQESGNQRNLFTAMRVFDALGAYGIRYLPDPNNPFSRVSATRDAVDQVQYPRQLLASRAGDCDDMSVLYCSLLENLGVPTAFLDGPGHILMLFDTGLHVRNRSALSVNDDLTVVRDDRVWIPIETTMIGKSFLDAWVEGADIYARWKGNPDSRVATVQDAWAEYEPELPSGAAPRVTPPAATEVSRRADADMDTLRLWQRTYLEEKYLKPLKESQNLDAVGGAGVLLAREGRFPEAEEKFRALVAARPDDAIALNDLGNVELLTGRPDVALERYLAAQALRDDPGILLNEGLARWARGDRAGADSAFTRAVARLGDPEKALDLLGIPAERGAGGRGGRPARLSPEEIRQRLRLAAARVPPPGARGGAAAERRPASPVVSKVSGSRAADARGLAGVVYWMDYGKETQP
jgi:tetratricopeptide (TPR) repeat protein